MGQVRMWALLTMILALAGTVAYGAQSRILDDSEGEQWINATADTNLKHAGETSARWDTAEPGRSQALEAGQAIGQGRPRLCGCQGVVLLRPRHPGRGAGGKSSRTSPPRPMQP